MNKLQTWTRKPYEVQVRLFRVEDVDVIQLWLLNTEYGVKETPIGYALGQISSHISPILWFSDKLVAQGKTNVDKYIVKHGAKVKVLTLEQLQAEYEQRHD